MNHNASISYHTWVVFELAAITGRTVRAAGDLQRSAHPHCNGKSLDNLICTGSNDVKTWSALNKQRHAHNASQHERIQPATRCCLPTSTSFKPDIILCPSVLKAYLAFKSNLKRNCSNKKTVDALKAPKCVLLHLHVLPSIPTTITIIPPTTPSSACCKNNVAC